MIFQEDYAPAARAAILGIDDHIVDVEVLANRDCLSVWGLARRRQPCLTRRSAPAMDYTQSDKRIEDMVKIRVDDPELCPGTPGASYRCARWPSPMWLRSYLHAAGMRAINNIVDITNFVMLETGHPMHAFDLDQVRGREIIVRRAHPGETLTTLDGRQHSLNGNELMICDAQGPTGLAGIMGGLESEITEKTHSILFECASFDRANTRLSAPPWASARKPRTV